MRGQQPEQDPFESPFAVTILPSSTKRMRRRGSEAAAPSAADQSVDPQAEQAAGAYDVPASGGTAAAAAPAYAPAPTYAAAAPAYAPATPGYAPAAPPTYAPPPGFAAPPLCAGPTGYAAPTQYADAMGYPAPPEYGPPPAYGSPSDLTQPGFANHEAPAGAHARTKKARRPLLIAAVVVVVLGVLAALGVAEKARLAPAHRTATIPATVLGLPQEHNPTLDAAAKTARDSMANLKGTFKNPQVAYFGHTGVPKVAVIAANVEQRPSSNDRQQFFVGMAKQVGASVTLRPVASGPFGGTMECGAVTFGNLPATMCASLDSAAYVAVIAFNTKASAAESMTRTVISTVEH